jgi:uncharacterized protein YegP (UPF0339 family)
MTETWLIFKDALNEWRWKHTASDRKIIGASPKGFKTREECLTDALANGYKGE